jgi:protein-S-isoprenylcysteine O-methyltransferase Ste14
MARSMLLRLWIFRHRGGIPVLFVLSAMFFASPTYPYEPALDVWLDLLGVAVIGLGLTLRLWAVGHAGAHTRSCKLRAPRLVTTGPYACVRNPIYLGNLLIGLGVVVMAESWICLGILFVGFSLEYGAIVSLEEEFLTRTFGEAYLVYVRRVPRWVPKVSALSSTLGGEFSWRATRKEYHAVFSALAMAGAVELGKRGARLFLP